VAATDGVALESWRKPEKKTREGLPYLKIMIVIVVLVPLGHEKGEGTWKQFLISGQDKERSISRCLLEQDPAL
jgi:hypothetical protein